MKKLTFTIAEILQLNQELTGSQHQSGVLSLKLNMVAKYRLSKLAKKVQDEIKIFEKIQLELFEKYGKQDETGNWTIPTVIQSKKKDEETKPNPDFLKFQEEIEPVMKEEKELEIPRITLEDFKGAETDAFYPIFFERILVDEEEEQTSDLPTFPGKK